jgi:Thaumatin family
MARDWWDIYAVNGMNLPMKVYPAGPMITNGQNPCTTATCDILPADCPNELQYSGTTSGTFMCSSVCGAMMDDTRRATQPVLQGMYNNKMSKAQVSLSWPESWLGFRRTHK